MSVAAPAHGSIVPPEREQDLNGWALRFAARLAAVPGHYGIDPGQLALLQSAADAYDAALRASIDPATRTPPRIAGKREAKARLLGLVRPTLNAVGAYPGLAPTDRIDLGMNAARNPRPPRTATPSGRPLVFVDNRGRVRLADERFPTAGHRPADATGGAFLFAAITDRDAPCPPCPDAPFDVLTAVAASEVDAGDAASAAASASAAAAAATADANVSATGDADASVGTAAAPPASATAAAAAAATVTPAVEARFAAMTTAMTYRLPIPPKQSGRVLWVYARWCNRRGVPGPLSAPASVLLVG